MTGRRDTDYAVAPDGVHVAYQVAGDGTADLLIKTNILPIDLVWEEPRIARALNRLAALRRVIIYDRRGMGASDPVPDGGSLSWETTAGDVIAVLDAVGSTDVTLLTTDSAATAVAIATEHSPRVSALVLLNSYARLGRAPDYPIGIPEHVLARYLEALESWTEDVRGDILIGDRTNDELFRSWFLRALRASGGPRGAGRYTRLDFGTDVRHLLGDVRVPALCIHTERNAYVDPAHGRYLAERLEGARFVELAGSGHHLATVDLDVLVDEIAEFLTGERPHTRTDRVVTTVLFTDIVASTERAVVLGDRSWRELLEQHHTIVRRHLRQYGGLEVDNSGDGFLATFDSPTRAVLSACAIRDAVRALGVEIRAGIHIGEVERHEEELSGVGVHIGARVMAAAQPSEVLVSKTVADVVTGSGIAFAERGMHSLKGVPGEWSLLAVN